MSTYEAISAVVYTKEHWDDESWTLQPYLECVECRWLVAPSCPSATLRYNYGDIKRYDASTFSVVTPPSLGRYYVKIAVACPSGTKYWYGTIEDVNYTPMQTDSEARGTVIYTARGLSNLLAKITIKGSYIYDVEEVAPDEPTYIGWCPPFNERFAGGGRVMGNAITATYPAAGTSYAVFGGDDDGSSMWSHLDIMKYLLTWVVKTEMDWTITDNTASQDLDNIETVIPQDCRRVVDIVNQCVDSRRGYIWYVDVVEDEGVEKATIVVNSVFTDGFTAGGETFHSNATQHFVSAATDDRINSLLLSRTYTGQYDVCEIIGSRIKTVFSLSNADGTLESLWDSTNETLYENAKSASANYDDMNIPQKAKENDLYRGDDMYARVYSYFGPPKTWDWKVSDGQGSVYMYVNSANPVYTDGVLDPKQVTPHMSKYRHFLPSLPLFEGVNYRSGAFYEDPSPEAQYRKPMAFVYNTKAEAWRMVDDLSADEMPNARLIMSDREMGIWVKFKPAHILAGGDFPDTAEPSEWKPVYDWKTMIVTVAVEGDDRLRVVEVKSGHSLTNSSRLLTIHMPQFECHYVCDGTIIGIDDDGSLIEAYVHEIRNDANEARRIAALALAWYGQDRASFSATYNVIADVLPLASLVTTVTTGTGLTVDSNSVITQVLMNFDQQSTTYSADFFELDPQKVFISYPNMPSMRALIDATSGATNAAQALADEEPSN